MVFGMFASHDYTVGVEGMFGSPKYFGQMYDFFCSFGFPRRILSLLQMFRMICNKLKNSNYVRFCIVSIAKQRFLAKELKRW